MKHCHNYLHSRLHPSRSTVLHRWGKHLQIDLDEVGIR